MMNRSIKELRENLNGKIYIYLKDQETAEKFKSDAEKEGYTFQIESNDFGKIVALEKYGISFPGFVGHLAFSNPKSGKMNRIDIF